MISVKIKQYAIYIFRLVLISITITKYIRDKNKIELKYINGNI